MKNFIENLRLDNAFVPFQILNEEITPTVQKLKQVCFVNISLNHWKIQDSKNLLFCVLENQERLVEAHSSFFYVDNF